MTSSADEQSHCKFVTPCLLDGWPGHRSGRYTNADSRSLTLIVGRVMPPCSNGLSFQLHVLFFSFQMVATSYGEVSSGNAHFSEDALRAAKVHLDSSFDFFMTLAQTRSDIRPSILKAQRTLGKASKRFFSLAIGVGQEKSSQSKSGSKKRRSADGEASSTETTPSHSKVGKPRLLPTLTMLLNLNLFVSITGI